jgi:hypothetical protein
MALAQRGQMVYTYTMVRTQIYLSRSELTSLQRFSRATGKTRSQLIRQAIDQMRPEAGVAARVLAGLSTSAGAWKRRQSGERLVERMRRGRLARLHG